MKLCHLCTRSLGSCTYPFNPPLPAPLHLCRCWEMAKVSLGSTAVGVHGLEVALASQPATQSFFAERSRSGPLIPKRVVALGCRGPGQKGDLVQNMWIFLPREHKLLL